jgi:hypothetical protein
MYGVIDEEHIQVAVVVIIEENRLGVEARDVQSILMGLFRKGEIAIVDKKLVAAMEALVGAYFGYIDIQEPVAVDIGYGYAGLPVAFALYTGFFRDILKPEIPLVEIKFVTTLVGSKIEVRQPIVVEVANGYTASIVIIKIVQDIEAVRVCDTVLKIDPGGGGRQWGE